jgi:microcystin-dependent protein
MKPFAKTKSNHLEARYPALFAVIRTTYGGDGVVTFGLPDLTGGRAPIGPVSGANIGESLGSATVTIEEENLPPHTHSISHTHPLSVFQYSTGSDTDFPKFDSLTTTAANAVQTTVTSAQPSTMISGAGSGTKEALNIRNPSLVVQYIIRAK